MNKFFCWLFSFLAIIYFFPCPAGAYSVRSLGMGDVYSAAAHDPSGIFYNPAYLARADSIRLAFDDTPRPNLAFSIGDLGIAGSDTDLGSVYSLAQGFSSYSFLRLGVGMKFLNDKNDFDVGLDADINKNLGFSLAGLNIRNILVPGTMPVTLSIKTEDGDKCLGITYDRGFRIGYENQVTAKAFWRLGYNVDHPTFGLTIPLNQNVDFDLALDAIQDNSKILWGINLFRNTENKRVNSNHSINFGPAIEGRDKFITIEGYNIHYVEAGKGYPLVLIGGGIHYTHHWDPYMKELATHYRVINIDQLGAGESDKPQYFFGYTIEEQGEIINSLLDKIGIKECYVLGYCYGGSIAFYLADQYPEKYKKIIAIEGFVRGITTIPLSDNNQSRLAADQMKHQVEYLNAYLVKDYVTFSYRLDYPYFNGKMWYQLNKEVLYIDLRDSVKDLKAPVLYYAGTKSWAYDFLGPTKDYLKANVKNLEYLEIEGAGHDVDRFDQKKFMSTILSFMQNQ
ncbi:MAG: alpha/beta fold hydrolase [Candidatus Saganbacteria bacterium]|nr:alpha/beta fold hydrolase [Candidatus Saganbacteria bacterium]